jgi:hypothetical protein
LVTMSSCDCVSCSERRDVEAKELEELGEHTSTPPQFLGVVKPLFLKAYLHEATNFPVAPCSDPIRTDPYCEFGVARHAATRKTLFV